ncbi:hypothetical protein J3458_019126 [Metarhizium acridum]|uniref:uncharacterized protein n=1 Tax=Metarhizium acridum TaxID=92637 RepID=UPI001C6B150D|nr:hypothetical protein J3458_019126 [Metarhizium acridum]
MLTRPPRRRTSALFKRGPRFPWTPYLCQCCDALTDARAHESDARLVALVRIQRIADGAYSILAAPGGTTRDTRTYGASLEMAVAHVRRELDSFVAAQPEAVKQDRLFTACHRVLTMRLYEPAMAMAAPPPTDSDSLLSEPFLRAESLDKCLDSSGASFAALLSIPPSQLCRLPLAGTAALAFTIVTTCRLLLLDTAPDWQPDVARKKLDFAAALRGIQDNFGHADKWAVENARKRRLRENDDAANRPDHYTSNLGWIRQWYMSKAGQAERQSSEAQAQEGTLTPADAQPWPDARLDFEFWPDLIAMSDVAMQTFSGNTWSDI